MSLEILGRTARARAERLEASAPVGAVLDRLAGQSDPVVLESSAPHESFGRYTILACRPLEVLSLRDGILTDSGGRVRVRGGDEQIWAELARAFSCVPSWHGRLAHACRGHPARASDSHAPDESLMPYGPGWLGYVGYEVGRHVERLPGRAVRDTHFPDLRLGFYDAVAVFDAVERTWTLSELVYDESGAPPGAGQASDCLRRLLADASAVSGDDDSRAGSARASAAARPAAAFASNFTPQEYQRAVRRCIDYIAAGDIFQANLSQRLTVPRAPAPLDIYRSLRRRNPAWYSAFLRFESAGRPCAIACSSPELFLRVRGGEVLTRPIKGTRPRVGEERADADAARDLLASPKDNAELTMIVDLLRNDLGRVCRYGSVRVAEARALEIHPTVYHLVGTVRGRLREDVGPAELLRATFPGGSITGAPKIRAMEIIDELEGVARGVYTGCVGWVGAGGDCEWNIAIRTVLCDGDTAYVPVGGGIVADSDPLGEYQETLDKARALLEAIAQASEINNEHRIPNTE